VFGAIPAPEVRAVGPPGPPGQRIEWWDLTIVMLDPLCIVFASPTILFGPQGMPEGAFDGTAAAPDPKRFKGNYFDPSGGPPVRVPSGNPPPALWHCFHGPHNRILGKFGRRELPVPPLSHPPPLPAATADGSGALSPAADKVPLDGLLAPRVSQIGTVNPVKDFQDMLNRCHVAPPPVGPHTRC